MPLEIDITYNEDFNEQQKAAVQRAGETWTKTLDSTVKVRVNAYWLKDGFKLNAMCVPNAAMNFKEGEQNTWYVSSLADKLEKKDLKENQPDMAIFFNGADCWNTSKNKPKETEYDLETVALHEMCHGFGFVGLFDVNNGEGSYGNNELTKKIPTEVEGLLPFDLPQLNNYPSIYGKKIVDKDNVPLTNTNDYTNPSEKLARTLQGQSGEINFLGDEQATYNIYTPNQFKPFTSIDHVRSDTYPESLMKESIKKGDEIRTLGENDPAQYILKALGW